MKVKGKTWEIIDTREGRGKEHDFNMYKRTIGTQVHEAIPVYTDLGYVGIQGFHVKSKVPRKASKKHPLSEKDKAYNKRLAKRG